MMRTHPWTICIGLFTACVFFLGLVAAIFIDLSNQSIGGIEPGATILTTTMSTPIALVVVIAVTTITFAIEASVHAIRRKTDRGTLYCLKIIGLVAREMSQILVSLARQRAAIMELSRQADIQRVADSFDFILGDGNINRFEGCS